jgi:outer membrane protein TolC
MKSDYLQKLIVAWVIAALAALFFVSLNGCDESRYFDPADLPPASAMKQIDTTSLERESQTDPVPIDSATTRALEAQTRPSVAETIELSLEQARMAALENNLDLKVSLFNPAIAQQNVDVESAKFETTFGGSANYGYQQTPGDAGQNQLYSANLTVPLQNGALVTLAAPFTQTAGGSPPYQGGLQFSISQPLLRNAGTEVNTYSIRAAKYGKGIVDAQTKLDAIRILANVDRAYWLLYQARAELKVNQDVYDLGLKQIDQAKKRVAAQASPRIEITRAESGAASALESIIESETTIRQQDRALKVIMHRPDLPLDSPVMIIPRTAPDPVGLTLEPHALVAHALVNRMEMLQLELQLSLDAGTVDFQRNQTLPLFVLDYTYNLNRFGNQINQAIDFTHGANAPQWSVGLNAQIPIGNDAAKAQLRQAILQRVQRLATREQQSLAIRQEVYDALDQFNQDWQRILAARNESILAGRTYLAERRQFELGVRTSTDVLYAAQQLADAQSREVQALTDYEIARVDIAFATGTLLGQGRVQFTRG